MKKIILSLVLLLITFILLTFFQGLKREKVYDTKDLIGKSIAEVNLKILNEDKSICS